MAHPPYLKAKARELRIKKKMSLDEIAKCLSYPKTTVWYWIRDLPDPEIKHRDTPGRRKARAAAAKANRARFRNKRDAAYRQGWAEFAELDAQPGFRDFVCMFIGEGYKRSKNTVSIANSNPAVMWLADRWIRRLTKGKVVYAFQYHADQDPEFLIRFWSSYLGADPASFRAQRKSNSGQLRGRMWRSKYGVLTVTTYDTMFRCRLQAWVDRVKDGWVDSLFDFGA